VQVHATVQPETNKTFAKKKYAQIASGALAVWVLGPHHPESKVICKQNPLERVIGDPEDIKMKVEADAAKAASGGDGINYLGLCCCRCCWLGWAGC